MQYQNIVFMDGDEADIVLEVLDEHGEEAAIGYLTQWDHGDGGGEINDNPQSGSADDTYTSEDGMYRLTWNRHLNYIGLEGIINGYSGT